jgi:hypothetical protein
LQGGGIRGIFSRGVQSGRRKEQAIVAGKCNALLMADRVIKEDNGKRGIIGSFNTFNLPSFPMVAPPFYVYANLEDFSGMYEFSVTITREGAELVVFSAGGEIQIPNQEDEVDLIVPAFGVTFPKPGIYNLILKVGNSTYGSRRIIVKPQKAGGG